MAEKLLFEAIIYGRQKIMKKIKNRSTKAVSQKESYTGSMEVVLQARQNSETLFHFERPRLK